MDKTVLYDFFFTLFIMFAFIDIWPITSAMIHREERENLPRDRNFPSQTEVVECMQEGEKADWSI